VQVPTLELFASFTVQLPLELFVETFRVPVEGEAPPPVLALEEPPPPQAEKRKADTNNKEIK